jgi:ABC-2 type transport system ATP-binding protein
LLQKEVYDLLLEAKKNGKTIFFSSHNLDEVQRICDRVGIVKDGSLVSVEDIDNLNKKVPRILEVRLTKPDQERLQSLRKHLLEIHENDVRILIHQNDNISNFLEILLPMQPEELAYPPASLEAYFMQFYKKEEKVESI